MKKRFTRILAALALLVGLTIPMGVWGQSDYSTIYTSDCTLTAGTNGSACGVIVDGNTFNGIKVGTGSNGGDMSITVPAGTKYLHIHVAAWNGVSNLSLNITPNTNLTPTSVALSANSGIANNTPFTFSGNPSTSDYYKVITFTNALTSETTLTFSTSIKKRFVIWGVNAEEEGGSDLTSTTTTITAPQNFNNDLHVGTTAGQLSATVTYNNNGTPTNVPNASVTWGSSDEDVATVDANGNVTLVAAGNTNITATYAGNTTYAPSTGTYQLNVVDNTPFNGVIFDATEDTGTSPIVKDNVSLACTNGVLDNGSEYRFYKNSTTTISTTDGSMITKIEFIGVSGNPASGFGSQDGWTTSGNNGVWQGEATSVQFVASGAQVRATEIRVSVVANTNPVITANDVNILYDATSGSITYTITNGVEGGAVTSAVVTASNPENWLTVNGSSPYTSPISLTCAANTTATEKTATVTLTYTYNRETVTETVNVTQAADPNATMTIAEVRALNTGATVATKGVVTSISVSGNNKTAYFQDNTAGIVAYGPFTTTVAVGDEIRVEGELTSYNGLLEIGKSNAAPTVTVLSHNNTVTPVVKTIDEISNDIQAQLVKVENATVTAKDDQNTTIAQGQNTIVVRGISGVEYAVNDVLTLTANVGCYNSNAQLVNPQNVEVQAVPSITVDEYTIEVSTEGEESGIMTVQYNNIDEIVAGIQYYYYEEDVLTETDEAYYEEWFEASINDDNNVEYIVEANTGDVRYAYFKIWAFDNNENPVYSELITIEQEAYEAPSASIEGTICFSNQSGCVAIQSANVTGADDLGYNWTITTEGTTSFTANSSYYQVGKSAEPATSITFTTTLPKDVLITEFSAKFGGFNGTAGIVTLKVGETTVGSGNLNGTNDVIVENNTTSIGKVLTVTVTEIAKGVKCYYISYTYEPVYPLTINGYTDDNAKTGYYLIASPVTVDPAEVDGMTEDDFDLYYFDESQELEWRNYEATVFNLVPGKGYLYAKKGEGQTYNFTLTGAPYNNQPITLSKSESGDFAGWNLVGNPFGDAAYITKSYYRMNSNHNEVVEGSGAINPMEGVFVIAAQDEEQLTFSTTAPTAPEEDLVVNLNSSRGTVIDRAVVRFGQGDQLPKFQINPRNTKIYVTEGNKDYAIVRSAAEAEMPVSFRASENGTYTLAVEAENVEMNYLHLIDNLTGMDVDLLQTPSYTFEAKTSDYASRFRLVFKANSTNENNAETFAYFNGTNWTVSNVGDATLQVVDVTGRTVANQMINGNAELNLNQPAGVYVIRLVNGDNVKTQKVVVR